MYQPGVSIANAAIACETGPMTPEQEAEAVRLCEDMLRKLDSITEKLDAFLATPPPYLEAARRFKSSCPP
jgi:hypothetical protein